MVIVRVAELAATAGQRSLLVTELERDPRRRWPDVVLCTATITVPADAPAAYVAALARKAMREAQQCQST